MIYNLDTHESAASRMLDLIARCAPKMMRAGGGPLITDETHREYRPKLTTEQRTRILELGRAGELNATEIAREIGPDVSQSAVYKLLWRHGIQAPDGRNPRNRRAAA